MFHVKPVFSEKTMFHVERARIVENLGAHHFYR
jgi:hypothetical protein